MNRKTSFHALVAVSILFLAGGAAAVPTASGGRQADGPAGREASESMPEAVMVIHTEDLDIVDIDVRRSEIIEVATGRKVKMSDGERHELYETHLGKDGKTLLTVRLQMLATATDGQARFDPRRVRLVDPGAGGREPISPFAYFADPDWIALPDKPIAVDHKGEAQLAFELPDREAPKLVLSFDDTSLGSLKDLLQRSRPAGS
jgi:hypothetical protein